MTNKAEILSENIVNELNFHGGKRLLVVDIHEKDRFVHTYIIRMVDQNGYMVNEILIEAHGGVQTPPYLSVSPDLQGVAVFYNGNTGFEETISYYDIYVLTPSGSLRQVAGESDYGGRHFDMIPIFRWTSGHEYEVSWTSQKRDV